MRPATSRIFGAVKKFTQRLADTLGSSMQTTYDSPYGERFFKVNLSRDKGDPESFQHLLTTLKLIEDLNGAIIWGEKMLKSSEIS